MRYLFVQPVGVVCCLQVVKVGMGRKKEDSDEFVKPNVEVGQTVMYSKYSGTEFEVRLECSYGCIDFPDCACAGDACA